MSPSLGEITKQRSDSFSSFILKLCSQEEFSTPHRSPMQCVVMNRIPRPPQIPSTLHRIRGLPEIKSKEECCKKIAVGKEGEGNVHYTIWSI
jgi:hypothetical protein